jgi:hypothetical protein
MTGRQVKKTEAGSQVDHFQAPWRSVGIGVGAIGTPVVTATCLHPVLGLFVFAAEGATLAVIFGAALFGTPTISDRAFRLLRWLAGKPEPTAPPSTTGPTSVTTSITDPDNRTPSAQ